MVAYATPRVRAKLRGDQEKTRRANFSLASRYKNLPQARIHRNCAWGGAVCAGPAVEARRLALAKPVSSFEIHSILISNSAARSWKLDARARADQCCEVGGMRYAKNNVALSFGDDACIRCLRLVSRARRTSRARGTKGRERRFRHRRTSWSSRTRRSSRASRPARSSRTQGTSGSSWNSSTIMVRPPQLAAPPFGRFASCSALALCTAASVLLPACRQSR